MAKKTGITFKTIDHPEANGKTPANKAVQYDLWFPLEDGRGLHVLMGEEGMRRMRNVVLEELYDDKNVTGN